MLDWFEGDPLACDPLIIQIKDKIMKTFLMMLCIPLTTGAGALAYVGLDSWSNTRQNEKNTEIFANQEVATAVAAAGYRLQATFGQPIVAYCDRRDDTGPLPCDPFPTFRGIDIRVASR